MAPAPLDRSRYLAASGGGSGGDSDTIGLDETEFLELLKLRFGDEPLEDCQVMVQDMVNSRRDTSNIHHIDARTHALSATIISACPETRIIQVCAFMILSFLICFRL